MQKKKIASLTAAAVMALSSAAAVVPASADVASVNTVAAVTSVEASSAKLKFNANGGTIMGAKTKTYKKGKAVGALPTAKKTGYVFNGWYTKKSGGKKVAYNTKFAKCSNKTVFAHWAKASQPNLKYKFSNSFEGFNYPSDYYTPYERYAFIFDKKYATWIWDQVGWYEDNGTKYYVPWGGNCFGMSTTSAMNVTGKTNIHTFNKKATYNRNLSVKNKSTKLGLTVGKYCEAVQLTQYNWNIQHIMYGTGGYTPNHKGDYKGLINRVKKCQKGKGAPVIIGTMSSYGGGHAILGYKFKSVDKYTDKIYVYDCNWPDDKNTAITLYKDSAGNYTDFSYEGYDVITYLDMSNAYTVWRNRGKKSASGMTDKERSYYGVDSRANATIYDKDGNVYATIKDGKVEGGDSLQLNILADKLDTSLVKTVFSLPKGEYTIKTDDGSVTGVSVFTDGKTSEAKGSLLTVNTTGDLLAVK